MSEFALRELLESGESMNYSESRETIEKLIASKQEAREKREAESREGTALVNQSPAGILIAEQRRQSEEFQAETAQFVADLKAGGMTPELKLRAAALQAKGKDIVAGSKADAKSRREKQRAMRQPYSDEVEKTRSALKDDPGPRG